MTSKRHVDIAREAIRRILENEGKEDQNGRWVTLDNGVHVFINKGGDISKGPAELTGRNLNDLKADKPAAGSGPGAPPSIRPETPPETAKRNAYAEGPEADADKIAQAREFLRSKGFHVPDAPINQSKAGAREVKGPRITYMDPEKIIAQGRVKQFKAGADEKTGEVEPLEGAFDHRGSGPLQIWEGLDGTMEVISGRHRLALAKRSGVGEVPVQIYREKDGFTLEQAKALDAELNIRDGNGSVADYAQFFRANKMTRDQAKEKGLLGRAKGQDGWEIGQGATEELLAALKGKQINDKQAATISRILPGDQAGQSLGLKLAGDGKTAEAIGDMLQAYKLHSARRKADADQLDMFGNNDAAIKEMMENAAKAGTIRRGLSARILAAQGAAKRPEIAKEMGINVDDPEAVKSEINRLQGEVERWKNWAVHPDLVAQVFGHDPKDNPLLQAQPDLPPEGRTVPEPLRSQEEVEGDLEKTFTDRGNDQTPSMFGDEPAAPAPEPEPEPEPAPQPEAPKAEDTPAPPPAVDLFGNPVKRNFAGPEMMTDLFGGKVAVDAQKEKPQETIADQAAKGLDWLDQKQQAKTDGTGEMFGSLFSPGNMPAPPPKLDEQGDTVADTLGLSKTDGPAFKGDPEQAKEMAIRALKDHKGWMSKADLDAIVGGDARRALEDSGELKVRMDTEGNQMVALKGARNQAGLMDADTLDGFQAVGLGSHKLAPENEANLAAANQGVETVQAKAAKKFANPDYRAPKGFKVPKNQKEHDERVNKGVEDYGKHIDNLKKVLAAQATMPTRGVNGKFFLENPEGGPAIDFGMNEGMAKKRATDWLKSRAQILKAKAAKAHAEVKNLDEFRNAHEGDPYQAGEAPKPKPKRQPVEAQRDERTQGQGEDLATQPEATTNQAKPEYWQPSREIPEFHQATGYKFWSMGGLTPEEKQQEAEFQKHARDNYEELRHKYLQKKGAFDENGKLTHANLNIDDWRDFMPGYTGLNQHVNHTAANYLNARLLHELKHELKGVGNGKMAIMAGGGGSGKTTAVSKQMQMTDYPLILDQVSAEWDGPYGAKAAMDNARQAGFEPEFHFVDRHPWDAWEKGIVPRFLEGAGDYQKWVDGGKQGPEPEKGRPVDLNYAMDANIKARKAALEAAKEMAASGKPITIYNNNLGKGLAQAILDPQKQIEYLGSQNHDPEELKRRAKDGILDLYRSGKISRDHATGLIGGTPDEVGSLQPGAAGGSGSEAGADQRPAESRPGGTAPKATNVAPDVPANQAGPGAPPAITPEAPGRRAKRASLTKAGRQAIEDEIGRLSTVLAGLPKNSRDYNRIRLQLWNTRKKLANLPASGAGELATSAPPASAPLAADPAPAPAPAPAPQVKPEAPAAQAQEDDLDHIDWEETKAMGLPNKVNGWNKGEVKVFNKYKDHPEIQAILKKQKAHQDAWNSGKKPTRSDFSSYDLDQKLEDLDALDRSEGQHPGEMHPWNFMVRQPEYQEFRKAERNNQHGKANKLRLAMRDRHLGHLAKMMEDGREGEISQENQKEFARELRQIKAQIEDKRGPAADDAEHQEQVRNLFSDLKGKLELDQQNGREEGHPDEWEHQEKAALEHLRGAKHKKPMLDHLRRSFVHVYDKMREKLNDDPTQYGDIGGEILRHDRDIAQARADAAKPAGKAKKTSPQDEEARTAAAFEQDVIAHNNKPAPEPEPFDPFRDSINQHGHPAAKLKAALGHMGDNPNQAGELAQRLKAEFPEAYQEGIDNKLQIPVSLRKHFQGTPTPAPAGPSAPPPVEDVSSLPVATQMSKLADRLKIIANGYNGKGASLKARAHKEYQKVSGQLQELMDNHPDEVDSHQLRQVMHNLTGRTIKGQDQDEILRTVNNQHDGSGKFQPLNAAWQRKQLETEINRLQTGLGVKLSDQEDPITVAGKLRQIDKLKRTIRALDDAAQASGYEHAGGWRGYATKEQQGAEERRNAYLKKRDIGEHHVTPLEKIANEVQGNTSGLMAALQKHSQELQGKYDDANFVRGTLLHDPLENPAVIDAIEKLPNKEDRYNASMGLNKSYNAIRRAVERGEDIPDEVLNYWGIPGAKTQPQAQPQPQEDEAPTQARPEGTPSADGTIKAKDGTVWKRAASGGEVSPVTGRHYKGGQWLPIHGMSIPRPESVSKLETKPEGVPTINQAAQAKSGGGPKPRRSDNGAQAHWDEAKKSPLAKLRWLGESPNYHTFSNGHIGNGQMAAFAREHGEDALKRIADHFKGEELKRLDEKWAQIEAGNDPSLKVGPSQVSYGTGKGQVPDRDSLVNDAMDSHKSYIENNKGYHSKAIRSSHPSIADAQHWLDEHLRANPSAQAYRETGETLAKLLSQPSAPAPDLNKPAPAPQGDRENADLDAFFADEPKPQAPAQAKTPDRENPDLDAVFDAPAEGPSAPPTPWTRGENPDLDKVMGGTEPAPQAKPQAAQGEDLFGAGMAPPAAPKPKAAPAKLRKPNRDEEYFMENRLPWSGRGEVDATKYFRSHSPDGEMEADAFVAHGNKHLEQFTSPAGRGRNGPPTEAHKPLEKYNLAQRAQHHLDEFLKEYEIPRETYEKTLAGGGDRNDKANLDHLIRSVKARILAEQNGNGNHLVIHNTDPVRKILGVDPREIISGSDSDLVPNRSRRARIVLNGPETEKGLIAGTHDEQFATGKNRYLFERPLDQREKGPDSDETRPENGGVYDPNEKRWIPFPEGPNAYKSEGGWSARQYRQNSKDLIGKDDLVDDIKKAVINRSISKKEALSRLAAVDRNVFHNYLGLQRMEHRSISDSLRAFINGQKDYEVKGEAPAQAPAPDLNKPAQAEAAPTPAPNDADWTSPNNGHAAYMDHLTRIAAGLEKGDSRALSAANKALQTSKNFLDPEGGYGNTWGKAYPDKFKAHSDLVSKVERLRDGFQEKPQGPSAPPAIQAKEQNFEQYLKEQGVKDPGADHGPLSPNGRVSQRSKDAMLQRQSEDSAKYLQAKREFQAKVDAGEVTDPTGRVSKTPPPKYTRGITRERLDSYNPAEAIEKLGNSWYTIQMNGKRMPTAHPTKTHAIMRAHQHKGLMMDYMNNPEGLGVHNDPEELRAQNEEAQEKAHQDRLRAQKDLATKKAMKGTPEGKRDAIYEKLIKHGRHLGNGLYEIPDKKITPQILDSLRSDEDRARRMGRPVETARFYLKDKHEVTGNHYDRGYILKVKTPENSNYRPAQESRRTSVGNLVEWLTRGT